MWKVTPITIAMLKNHQGIVKKLLQRDDIDVNGKDENGRTLLMMAISDLKDASVLEFVKFLIDKGADPSIADTDGNTCLHRLACYYKMRVDFKHGTQNLKEKKRIESETMIKVAQYLIDNGAPLKQLNEEKETPFALALENRNVKIVPILADQIKISESPQILFDFKERIFDDRYKNVLVDLLNKETQNTLTPEIMNNLDAEGFTPFLSFVKIFVAQRDDL